MSERRRYIAIAVWVMRVSGRVSSELMGDVIEDAENGRSALWLYTQAAYAVLVGTANERTGMNRIQSGASAVGRIAGCLALFYLLAFAGVQIGERWLSGWPATDIGLLLAEGIATVVALRFRAAFAAYLVLGFAAYTAAELVVHLVYGLRAAQGGPTHFAVMSAGLLGVGLGAMVANGWRAPQLLERFRTSRLSGA